MADNLQEALERARSLVARVCACGDVHYQHDPIDGCSILDCGCKQFRPAPLHVSLLEEPARELK